MLKPVLTLARVSFETTGGINQISIQCPLAGPLAEGTDSVITQHCASPLREAPDTGVSMLASPWPGTEQWATHPSHSPIAHTHSLDAMQGPLLQDSDMPPDSI